MDQVGSALTLANPFRLNQDVFPFHSYQVRNQPSSYSNYALTPLQQEYSHHHLPPSLQTSNSYRSSTNGSSLDYASNNGVSPMSANPHSASSHGSFPPTPALSPFSYQQNTLSQSSLSLQNGHGNHSPNLYTPPPSAPAYSSYNKGMTASYGSNGQRGNDDASVPLRRAQDSRYPIAPIGIPPIATLPTDEHSNATTPNSASDFQSSPRFGDVPEQKPMIEEAAGDCTAFISKLYHLLSRPEYGRFLRWNEAGDAFILMNSAEFAQFVLPRFFRHSNVSSFVRQINLYGFQRVSTICILEFADINSGDPTQGTDAVQASGFTHPFFRRGQRHLLKNLKPRSARRSKKSTSAGAPGSSGQGASANAVPKKEGEAPILLSDPKGKGGRRSTISGTTGTVPPMTVPTTPTTRS